MENNQDMQRRRREAALRRKKQLRRRRIVFGIAVLVVLAVIVVVLVNVIAGSGGNTPVASPGTSKVPQASATAAISADYGTPHSTDTTDPTKNGIYVGLRQDGEKVTAIQRAESITFGGTDNYTDLKGVITFRGNNFRNTATYGRASVTQGKFDTNTWSVETGSLSKSGGSGAWTGSGWTGQPLIVEWPAETRQIMNLYDNKKNKDGLVEVIYACMDGKVHFMDLEDGTPTRDSINIGMAFKGAGALDPRGYPILYVGAGDSTADGSGARAFIYSLVDGSKLYEFGANDPDTLRSWHAYDSSPLVNAATDTLIWPGENGILYTMKLNTSYDAAAGTLSINPSEQVKWRYQTDRSSEASYWLGVEDSIVAWNNYIYFADNGGNLFCMDVNTMTLVWQQDVKDDTNGSPVLELVPEDGRAYLYIGTSLHWTKKDDGTGTVPFFKVDAITGEIVWQQDYNCSTVSGVSGGMQATALLGENSISDLIIFPVARTPEVGTGIVVALDKNTKEEKWRFSTKEYSWSSPVAFYGEDGKAYIAIGDVGGNFYLIDGQTGTQLDQMNLGSVVEASPAVYGDTLVVGTRGQKIYGIKIK